MLPQPFDGPPKCHYVHSQFLYNRIDNEHKKMLTFTENEVRVLSFLARKPGRGVEIAKATDQTPSSVSRVLCKLVVEGLVIKGPKEFSVTTNRMASSLRKAILSEAVPSRVLVGGRLLVLLSVMRNAKTRDRIGLECGIRSSTTYQYIREMRNLGLVQVQGGRYSLTEVRKEVRDFLEGFALGYAEMDALKWSHSARVQWYDGLQFLISDTNEIPSLKDRMTGYAAMPRFGLDIRGMEWSYHVSQWNPELGPEMVALHIHLSKPESLNAISNCVLLLVHSGFDRKVLLEESESAGADMIMGKVADVASGLYREDRLIAQKNELDALLAQYGAHHGGETAKNPRNWEDVRRDRRQA
jgi:predicted transcriptional regulator